MNVFTEISTRELENTLKGKAVRYIVNDAGEGLCLFFEGWTDNTGSNHYSPHDPRSPHGLRNRGVRAFLYVCINFPTGQYVACSRRLPDVARVCTGKTKRRPQRYDLHTVPARRVIRLPIHRPADHAPTPRGPDLSSCGWHSLLHPGFRAGKDHPPSCTPGKYQNPRHTQTCTYRRPGRYSFLQLSRFSYNAASLPVGCVWLTP